MHVLAAAIVAVVLALASCGPTPGIHCESDADCPLHASCQHNSCKFPPCTSDADCSDGTFCNGVELCRPSAASSDAHGCVKGANPCGAARCDEARALCLGPCNNDVDGDGHVSIACGGDDCDDNDPHRYPGNAEVCDAEGHDEDCDDSTFGNRDTDGDGYFDAHCCNGANCGTDCDDTNASVHPSEAESCDGIDNDCDSAVDEMVMEEVYTDADGDGHGDPATGHQACAGTAGTSTLGNDCDDTNDAVYPGQMVCAKGTAVFICQQDGTMKAGQCAAAELCYPQPNGTGVCQ